MFATHQPRIAAYARQNADHFAEVITFVYVTVRNPLYRVPNDLRDIRKLGRNAAALWGWKLEAWEYLQAHKHELFADCERIYNDAVDEEELRDSLLGYLARLPGLGFAKAGFVAQLIYGVSACLDTHNMDRFGIKANTFKAAKALNGKAREHRKRYHETIDKSGGTAGLWNSWCQYVADNQPDRYASAWEVSALHCTALGLSA